MNRIYVNCAIYNFNIYILPVDIDQFYSVRRIRINYFDITTLPDEIFNLDLEHLIICHTNLKVLPREIKKCKNITILDLYGSKLKYIPKEICELKKLTLIKFNDRTYHNKNIYADIIT